jgi:uncharacterized membrane protein YbaN (DUF454 family)
MGGMRPLFRMVKIAVGSLLVLVGIAGLFLPLLQGILMIAAGLAILGSESRRVRRLNERLRGWYRGLRAKRAAGAKRTPGDGGRLEKGAKE